MENSRDMGIENIVHRIAPVFDEHSEILILGSIPSVQSRIGGFFYHHPRNRFWLVISMLFGYPLPVTVEDKKQLLLKNKLALWDVAASCDMEASKDSSIRNVVPNDLKIVLSASPVRRIFTNGATAHELYDQYCYPVIGIHDCKLPSTSPANASYSIEKLIQAWSVIQLIKD